MIFNLVYAKVKSLHKFTLIKTDLSLIQLGTKQNNDAQCV